MSLCWIIGIIIMHDNVLTLQDRLLWDQISNLRGVTALSLLTFCA